DMRGAAAYPGRRITEVQSGVPRRTSASLAMPTSEAAPTCAARPLTPAGGSQRFGAAFRDGRAPAKDQPSDGDDHGRDNRIFDVGEVVMEALVARPERPAGRGDPEAPRHAAEERQQGEADDWHPHDAGRNRDERAHDRRDPAQEDRGVAEAVEP